MKLRYYICDVFTEKSFGGNQLAVFPDATAIPEHLLQTIAKEFNFSETTFVFPSNSQNTKRVRIFTPGNELPFAGHPTIGTAIVLATIGHLQAEENETRIIFEEGVGPVPVLIRSEKERPVFAQLTAAKLPEFIDDVPTAEKLSAMLSLSRNDLADSQFPIQFVSVGFPFLFVAVKSRELLKRIRINTQIMEELKLTEVFVFAHDAERPDFDFRARMFAPLIGIPEDPATGSACVALAAYLAQKDPAPNGLLKWSIEQGFEMGRPSLLYIEAEKKDGKITATRVGGNTVMMMEGDLYI